MYVGISSSEVRDMFPMHAGITSFVEVHTMSPTCMQETDLLLQITFWEVHTTIPLGPKLPWPHLPEFAVNAPLRMRAIFHEYDRKFST